MVLAWMNNWLGNVVAITTLLRYVVNLRQPVMLCLVWYKIERDKNFTTLT